MIALYGRSDILQTVFNNCSTELWPIYVPTETEAGIVLEGDLVEPIDAWKALSQTSHTFDLPADPKQAGVLCK